MTRRAEIGRARERLKVFPTKRPARPEQHVKRLREISGRMKRPGRYLPSHPATPGPTLDRRSYDKALGDLQKMGAIRLRWSGLARRVRSACSSFFE